MYLFFPDNRQSRRRARTRGGHLPGAGGGRRPPASRETCHPRPPSRGRCQDRATAPAKKFDIFCISKNVKKNIKKRFDFCMKKLKSFEKNKKTYFNRI